MTSVLALSLGKDVHLYASIYGMNLKRKEE